MTRDRLMPLLPFLIPYGSRRGILDAVDEDAETETRRLGGLVKREEE
jgi:hypothetical protein